MKDLPGAEGTGVSSLNSTDQCVQHTVWNRLGKGAERCHPGSDLVCGMPPLSCQPVSLGSPRSCLPDNQTQSHHSTLWASARAGANHSHVSSPAHHSLGCPPSRLWPLHSDISTETPAHVTGIYLACQHATQPVETRYAWPVHAASDSALPLSVNGKPPGPFPCEDLTYLSPPTLHCPSCPMNTQNLPVSSLKASYTALPSTLPPPPSLATLLADPICSVYFHVMCTLALEGCHSYSPHNTHIPLPHLSVTPTSPVFDTCPIRKPSTEAFHCHCLCSSGITTMTYRCCLRHRPPQPS